MNIALEDLSVTVTVAPVIDTDTGLTWLPVYWEIRNSAMGEQLVDSIFTDEAHTWIYMDALTDERTPITSEWLRDTHGIPAPLITKLRSLLAEHAFPNS